MSSSSRASSPVDLPEYDTQFEPRPDDDETLWSVLAIHREDKHRYLVQWAGIDPKTGKPWALSWVPKRDCTDDLIHDWKVTKAKKAHARKKKRKSKGDLPYDPVAARKPDTSSNSRSNSRSTTSSTTLSSIAGPSKPRDNASGKVSPVVEIVLKKKRPRESHPLNDESEVEVTADVTPPKKKRKLFVVDGHSSLPSFRPNEEIGSPRKVVQLVSLDIMPRDHSKLIGTDFKVQPNGQSQSPRRPPENTSPNRNSHQRPSTALPEDELMVRGSRHKRTKKRLKSASSEVHSSSRTQPKQSQGSFKKHQIHKTDKSPIGFPSPKRVTSDVDLHTHDNNVQPYDDDDESVERNSHNKDRLQDPFQSMVHDDNDGIYLDMDDLGPQMTVDDMIPSEPDVDQSDTRSFSPPSARDLLARTDTIIPETQHSGSSSRPQQQVSTSSRRSRPLNEARPTAAEQPVKQSGRRTASPKPKSKRSLGPVPSISPSVFKSYLPGIRAVPIDSQLSSIETFTTPSKSQVKAQRQGNGKEKEAVPEGRKRLAYSQRQEEEEEEEEFDHDPTMHDAIEDFDNLVAIPLDQALKIHGQKPADAAYARGHSQRRPRLEQKSLSDVISSSTSSDGTEPRMDDDDDDDLGTDIAREDGYRQVTSSVEDGHSPRQSPSVMQFANSNDANNVTLSMGESPTKSRHYLKSASSAQASVTKPTVKDIGHNTSGVRLHDADGLANDERSEGSQTDELGPDDAPDGRGHTSTPRPADIPLSADMNCSLEVNAAWTQQAYFPPTVIESPIKHLNAALGLLHRKSEEIHKLNITLEARQSQTSDLEGQLRRLKRRLEVTERRYGEASAALDGERAAREAQEEKAEEERTAKDLTAVSSSNADRLAKLLQENEKLKASNTHLESDVDMLRRLYTQASDAHQVRVKELRGLNQENASLREQATTGVKQAGMFWEAQVRTLETELGRSRGAIEVLTDQARRTDDDVRRRAALLPLAQRETEAAKQEVEEWKDKLMELGRENTKLRIEVKDWEDEAMARRKKEQEMKRKEQESAAGDELVWMCPWMDVEHRTKCAILLESREKLREHFYEAGHL